MTHLSTSVYKTARNVTQIQKHMPNAANQTTSSEVGTGRCFFNPGCYTVVIGVPRSD